MQKNKILNIFTSIISIILIVISISFIYSLIMLDMFKKYYLIFISIITFILSIIFIKIIDNKKGKKILRVIFSIFSIIIIFIYFFIISTIITTFNFIDKIIQTKSEYQKYNVYTKEKIKNIKELNKKTIGFLEDNDITNIKKSLSESANISFLTKDYSENKKLAEALNNKEIDSIVLRDNTISNLSDNGIDIFNDFNLLYSYKIKVNNEYENKVNTNKPTIIYLTGSTKEEKLSNTSNNNINFLLVLNPKNNKIMVINIPKDTYVKINNKKDKLEYVSLYGIDKSIEAINDLFDIKINYYIKTNNKFLENSIDVLNGLDINSKKEIKNDICSLKKGNNVINNECAIKLINSNEIEQVDVMKSVLLKSKNIFKLELLLKVNENNVTTNLNYKEISDLSKIYIFNNDFKYYSLEVIKNKEDSYIYGENVEISKVNEASLTNIKKELQKNLQK